VAAAFLVVGFQPLSFFWSNDQSNFQPQRVRRSPWVYENGKQQETKERNENDSRKERLRGGAIMGSFPQ
jgi:hypothetical protein